MIKLIKSIPLFLVNLVFKMFLPVLAGLIMYGIGKLNTILEKFGIHITVTQKEVEEIILMIYNAIMGAEKSGKTGEEKLAFAIKNIEERATPRQKEVIKETFGTTEKAVESVLLKYAQPKIEAKKLTKSPLERR